MSGDSTLYPMLGVGAFMVMFWVGFLLGYEAGVGCLMLPCGLLFGAVGTQLVVKLEQRAKGEPGRRRVPPSPRHSSGTVPSLVLFRRADSGY